LFVIVAGVSEEQLAAIRLAQLIATPFVGWGMQQ